MSANPTLAARVAAAKAAEAAIRAANAAAVRASNAQAAAEAANEGSLGELLDEAWLAARRADLKTSAEKALGRLANAKAAKAAAAKAVAEDLRLVAEAKSLSIALTEGDMRVSAALAKGLSTCQGNLGRAKAEALKAVRSLTGLGGALIEGSEAAKMATELLNLVEAEAKAKAKARAKAEAQAARAKALRAADAPLPSVGGRLDAATAEALQALIRA